MWVGDVMLKALAAEKKLYKKAMVQLEERMKVSQGPERGDPNRALLNLTSIIQTIDEEIAAVKRRKARNKKRMREDAKADVAQIAKGPLF